MEKKDQKAVPLVDNLDALNEKLRQVREAQRAFATYTQEQVDNIFYAAAMAANRLVDLTSLVPGMRQCTITVGENGKTVLHAESGTVKIDRELTSSEMNRLSLILGNANLSEESKRTKIAGMVTGIVATQQASQNFEQGMEAESQQQNLQRK